jgi:hypothetical protein
VARLRLYGRIGGQRPISYVVDIESFRFEVKGREFTVDWNHAPADRDEAEAHLMQWVDDRLLALTLRTGRPATVEWAGASEFDPGDGRMRLSTELRTGFWQVAEHPKRLDQYEVEARAIAVDPALRLATSRYRRVQALLGVDDELALAAVQVCAEGLAAEVASSGSDWHGLARRLGFSVPEIRQLIASCQFGRHDVSVQASAQETLRKLGLPPLDAADCSLVLRRLLASYLHQRYGVTI